MNDIFEIHHVVRDQVLSNLWVGGRVCFSLFQPDDAGPLQAGNLFNQNLDFIMVEVMIDDVRRAGPGVLSPRRVWGGLELGHYTKDRLDPLLATRTLEQVGDWFREETIGGVRFRDFLPTGEVRDRGFQVQTATLPFQFETQPKQQ